MRRAPIEVAPGSSIEVCRAVIDDRYSRKDGDRQVTLIGTETLAAIGAFLVAGPIERSGLARCKPQAGSPSIAERSSTAALSLPLRPTDVLVPGKR